MKHQLDPCRAYFAQVIYSYFVGLDSAFSETLKASDIFSMLEKPPQGDMGDFALPCFRFAKALKLPPPKIAAQLAEHLNQDSSGWVKKVQTVQAFCNIFVNQSKIASQLLPSVLSEAAFHNSIAPQNSREKVMIEYSQPNTHKEFHVGHLRNVCLGSSLVKLYRYCGYQVTASNYFGDEGAHIAKCLWMMNQTKDRPKPGEDRGAWLGQIYVLATQKLAGLTGDDLKKSESEISEVLSGIEKKTGFWFDLWQETRTWSLDAFKEIYRWVEAEFDRDFFESEVSESSQNLVEEYLNKGVFKLDQGAVGIDLSDHKLGFMLARKRDGNTLYATKDLVLAKVKFEEYGIDRSIYVVANEQNHHFKQVFKTLEIMGFPQASKCFHLSYGMVVLPSGKMSSRSGNTVPFMKLKDSILEELHQILKKYEGEWPQDEINETARRLCIGALKYGMLQADPQREIVFDLKDWLSFEGNTGPYLMYSYARTKSILRKALDQGKKPLSPSEVSTAVITVENDAEVELLRAIYDFNTVVDESAEQCRPNHLATHLYSMCKSFNRFYSDVPILKCEDQALLRQRLSFIQAFASTLKQGLALLGITPPERM